MYVQHMNRAMQAREAVEPGEVRAQGSLSAKLQLSPLLIPYLLADI